MNHYENTQCDVCMKDRFDYGRYKCLRCHDYDLCATCFEAKASSGNHLPNHPMQVIFSIADMALFYSGEIFEGQNLSALTCSYCGQLGFTENTLMDHLVRAHKPADESSTASEESKMPVLCPLCVRRPAASSNYMTSNLAAHLTIEHQVPAPRCVISSLSELAVNALRNPPRAARNPNQRSHMDVFFLELMAHLPDARAAVALRDRQEGVFELQRLQNQMRQERQQARQQAAEYRLSRRAHGARQSPQEEPIVLVEGPPQVQPRQSSSRVSFPRSNVIFSQPERPPSGYGRGHSLSRAPTMESLEQAASSFDSIRLQVPSGSGGNAGGARSSKPTRTNVEANQNHPADDERFLLRTFLNPVVSDSEAAAIDRERADRSLFTQSLLLSAMSISGGFENQEAAGVSGSQPENTKPKKKNKRRRRSARNQAAATGDGNASQLSSQISQDDILHEES